MTYGCLKLTYDRGEGMGSIGSFFKEKILIKKSSVLWKFLFLVLRYIHSLVLIILFLNGSHKLNHFRNLGFMIFFVLFAGSEWIYRKCSFMLTIFIAFFIWSQYYFSLTYHQYVDDKRLMKRLLWYNFYTSKAMPTWKEGESIYFRHTPYPVDWIFLILMASLNNINRMYVYDDHDNSLTQKSRKFIQENYSSQIYNYMRIKNQIQSVLVFLILILQFYFIGKAQCTLINWVFWCLNLLALRLIAEDKRTEKAAKQGLNVANALRSYSVLILLLEIVFVCTVGVNEDTSSPHSYDQEFKRKYPRIYANITYIGLRQHMDPGHKHDPKE